MASLLAQYYVYIYAHIREEASSSVLGANSTSMIHLNVDPVDDKQM